MNRVLVVLTVLVAVVVTTAGPAAATGPRTVPLPAAPVVAAVSPVRDLCLPFLDEVCALELLGVLQPGIRVVRAAFGALGGAAAELAGGVVAATVGWFTDTLVAGARDLWGDAVVALTASTSTPVSTGTFASGPYRTVVKVAFGLLTVFVLVAVLHGLLAGVLAETWLRLVAQVPLAVLAIGVLPWATDQVAGLIDVICAAVAPSDQLLVGVGEGLASLPRTRLGLPALVLSLVGFLAVAVIYLELVVRNALVVATVALAPLSFAAMAWPAARPAARKVVELLAAVLVSKLATMVVLAVGVDLFARRDPVSSPSGFGQLVAALAVLVIAAGAPWITWRLLPVAEAALIGIGVARLPVRTATQVGQSAVTRQMTGRAASRPSGTAGAATGTGSSGGGGTRAGGWPAPSGAAPDPGPGPVRDEPVPRPRRRRR